MKKILILGVNSFSGSSFAKFIQSKKFKLYVFTTKKKIKNILFTIKEKFI